MNKVGRAAERVPALVYSSAGGWKMGWKVPDLS